MDFIIELLVELFGEIFLEGFFEGIFSKKVPLPLRILFAIVLLIIYGGLTIGLIYLGIKRENYLLLLIGIFILFLSVGAVIHKVRKHHR